MQAIAACRSGARCRAIDVLLIKPRSCEQRIRHRRASSSVRDHHSRLVRERGKLCGRQCSGQPWYSKSSKIAIVAGCWVFFSGWRTAGMRRINDLIEDPQSLIQPPPPPRRIATSSQPAKSSS